MSVRKTNIERGGYGRRANSIGYFEYVDDTAYYKKNSFRFILKIIGMCLDRDFSVGEALAIMTILAIMYICIISTKYRRRVCPTIFRE